MSLSPILSRNHFSTCTYFQAICCLSSYVRRFCVCVCPVVHIQVCICKYAHGAAQKVQVCTCACGSLEPTSSAVPRALFTLVFEAGTHLPGTWWLTAQLDWLASKSKGFTCLFLPSATIAGVCHNAWHDVGSGNWIQVFLPLKAWSLPAVPPPPPLRGKAFNGRKLVFYSWHSSFWLLAKRPAGSTINSKVETIGQLYFIWKDKEGWSLCESGYDNDLAMTITAQLMTTHNSHSPLRL